MTTPSLSALRALPDAALVPVGWVREVLASLQTDDGTHALGMTVAEVAEATGRAVSTVRTWCTEGRLPGAHRLRGREWRIPQEALEALFDGEDRPRGGGAERLEVPKGGIAAWRGTE